MYTDKTDELNEMAQRNQATRVLERMLAEQRSRLAAKLDVGGPSTPESALLCYDPITRT